MSIFRDKTKNLDRGRTDFLNCYLTYFRWNEGLRCHFFPEKNSGENSKNSGEILLFIDEYIIKSIGKNAGINTNSEPYIEHFKNSVKSFVEKFFGRKDVLYAAQELLNPELKCFVREKNGAGCRIICKDKKAKEYELPYLAIVIYVLLTIDDGKTQQWNNVRKALGIKEVDDDKDTNNNGLTCGIIPQLWENIHKYNDQFDKDARIGKHPNIGRLKYHLPLSAAARNRIKAALYYSEVGKFTDTMSFIDIIDRIADYTKQQEEIESIYAKSNSVKLRKIQTVIDDFDWDEYEEQLNSSGDEKDFHPKKINGKFALGIYSPEISSSEKATVVLLTNIQQGFDIRCVQNNDTNFSVDNDDTTYYNDGDTPRDNYYNNNFVRYNGSEAVEIKRYCAKNSEYNITSISEKDDKVFFFKEKYFFKETGEQFLIQTRELTPSKYYIIIVKNEGVENFKRWCDENNNKVEKFTEEDRIRFFGKNRNLEGFTIFDHYGSLNGQYYETKEIEHQIKNENCIIQRGGITKGKSDLYFITALPFFEIPQSYDLNKVKLYISFNSELFDSFDGEKFEEGNCELLKKDRRLIIDIKNSPEFRADGKASCNIGIELCKNKIEHFAFLVCGQEVKYDSTKLWEKYTSETNNNKNQRTLSDNSFVLEPFDLSKHYNYFYFTNLLAACCYSNGDATVSFKYFEKCVQYAATHLSLEGEGADLIKQAREAMAKGGVVNIDYGKKKCQAIPPTFIKSPFSTISNQKISKDNKYKDISYCLFGCYTKKFLEQVCNYCSDNIPIILLKYNNADKDSEKLLPPIIGFGGGFDPDRITKQHERFNDNDIALSLIENIDTQINLIFKNLSFEEKDPEFIDYLKDVKDQQFPRVRQDKNRFYRHWYLEKEGEKFAEITSEQLQWASLYCYIQREENVLYFKGSDAYIPKKLQLPNHIERAFYLMNMGLPVVEKVFICNDAISAPYRIAAKYSLYDKGRIEALENKFPSGSTRKADGGSHYNVWLWSPKRRTTRQLYFVLKNDNTPTAIGRVESGKESVYIRPENRKAFFKIKNTTINEFFSFLILNTWRFIGSDQGVGFTKDSGSTIDMKYEIDLNESISLTDIDIDQFDNKPLTIL